MPSGTRLEMVPRTRGFRFAMPSSINIDVRRREALSHRDSKTSASRNLRERRVPWALDLDLSDRQHKPGEGSLSWKKNGRTVWYHGTAWPRQTRLCTESRMDPMETDQARRRTHCADNVRTRYGGPVTGLGSQKCQ